MTHVYCGSLLTRVRFPSVTIKPTVEQLRPISLLPIMGKILEKFQIETYYDDVVSNYGPYQHAYRRSGSCTSAPIKMHDCVTRMLDDTTTVAVRAVLFDLTAAFDNIRHDILLYRMINCDLDSSFIKWCFSYLES